MASRETSNEAPDDQQTPTQIVCVYDQFDQQWYDSLKTYLVLWERAHRITWLDIQAGADTAQTMETYLQRADLILLLLSPTFFASHPCYNAMLFALHEQGRRLVPVVPIIARACDWKESACGSLKPLPANALPLAQWPHPEPAYEEIRSGITRLVPGLLSDEQQPVPPRLFQAPKLPDGYVPRPKEFAAAKQLLLHRQGAPATAITTALRGAGGFGKTTLALALCHDLEIQAAFPDGILWIVLGEHPSSPVDVLNGVLASLETQYREAIGLVEARERWRVALDGYVYLLVIDDVWQPEMLLPLLESGPQCRRLVTTRNDVLLPKDAVRVLVDVMELSEAVAVLCQDLPKEISQEMYQPQLEALVSRLGCWPLLLTLANGMLTDLVAYHLSIAEALTTIAEAYQTRGVTAFRLANINERQQNVDACLRVSMQHLEQFTGPHYHATERYQELAVFPDDTDIPLTTLQIFWKESAGLEPWETKDLCTRLHRLSLLLDCDLRKGTIRLHDVLRNYLIQQAGSHLPALHARLLDAYQQVLALTRWADLPPDEMYLWHHLILHLCQVGQREALQATLTDLSYLTRKALYVGVSALEADLLLASTLPSKETADPASSFFESLHYYIVRISHLLRQVQTEAEMGGLLLSHLGWEPSFRAQRHSLEHELPRPFLTAWHPLPDQSSFALLRTLHGHTNRIFDCAVSPDGRFIVSASDDNTLKVWDAATGAEHFSLRGHTGWVRSCSVSSKGRFIVSASNDSTLIIWELTTGAKRFSLQGHKAWVSDCAISPDERWIVSASGDKTLKVWNTDTGVERFSLRGHTATVFGCAVSSDGRWIVSASADNTLKVWDAAIGVERFSLRGHTRSVWRCAVSPDCQYIVSASADKTLKVWDTVTGVERFSLSGHTDEVYDCAVSPNGQYIVSASADKTLKVWNATTGVQCHSLFGHTDNIRGCAVSPNGQYIVSASDDNTLKVWDMIIEAEGFPLSGQIDNVRRCAVSPNGKFIVSASADNTLKVWDTAIGVERFSLSGHKDMVCDCAISPDSRFIVSASLDCTIKVWNAITGAERFSFSTLPNISSCAISPNGRFLAFTSSRHDLKVWDFPRGKESLSLFVSPVHSDNDTLNDCAISPDSRFIVSVDECTLQVWDAITGARRLFLSGHKRSIQGCAVSPNSRWIVSASDDRTLKVWDVITGVELLTLSGHTKGISACAVSPNERWIISASKDCTLKVWEAQTGHCILTFPVNGKLSDCAFHPDGEHLVACGVQGIYFLRLVM